MSETATSPRMMIITQLSYSILLAILDYLGITYLHGFQKTKCNGHTRSLEAFSSCIIFDICFLLTIGRCEKHLVNVNINITHHKGSPS